MTRRKNIDFDMVDKGADGTNDDSDEEGTSMCESLIDNYFAEVEYHEEQAYRNDGGKVNWSSFGLSYHRDGRDHSDSWLKIE